MKRDHHDGIANGGLRAVDPWTSLRAFTPARIGLGRSGDAITTTDQLALRLAHAQARDAVHAALDVEAVRAELDGLPVVSVRSAAPDRPTYLQRPDLGRRLADGEVAKLTPLTSVTGGGSPAGFDDGSGTADGPDVAFVIADGLSPLAIQRHAARMVHATTALLPDWTLAPIVIATQARVAIGDAIGQALGARFVVVFIGERPGLSAADSLGVYFTFEPRVGRADSERNCISNVRPPVGLSYDAAAAKLATMLREARRLGLTGVGLKDTGAVLEAGDGAG